MDVRPAFLVNTPDGVSHLVLSTGRPGPELARLTKKYWDTVPILIGVDPDGLTGVQVWPSVRAFLADSP